jgi:hypothetical protein
MRRPKENRNWSVDESVEQLEAENVAHVQPPAVDPI